MHDPDHDIYRQTDTDRQTQTDTDGRANIFNHVNQANTTNEITGVQEHKMKFDKFLRNENEVVIIYQLSTLF